MIEKSLPKFYPKEMLKGKHTLSDKCELCTHKPSKIPPVFIIA